MNRPAPVEVSYKGMRFLITHNPTNATLSTFVQVSGRPHVPHASLVSVAGGGAVRGCRTKYCPSEQSCRPGAGGAPWEGQQLPGGLQGRTARTRGLHAK